MAPSQGDYFSAPASFPALAFFCALASAFHSRVTRQRSRSFAARRDILSNRILQPPGTTLAETHKCRNEGVDLLFRHQNNETVAALIVGPYQNEQAYKQRRAEFVQRLIGLALVHGKVFGVAPKREQSELENIWHKYLYAVGRYSREAEKKLQRTLSFFHVR